MQASSLSQPGGRRLREAGHPRQRGALAPYTPETTVMGNTEKRPEPQQLKSGWRLLEGPYPGDPPALSSLLKSPNVQPGYLRHLVSPAVLPRLIFQGFGQQQKGPMLRVGTPQIEMGEQGNPS